MDAKNNLTSREICNIIKACAKAGVSDIKVYGVEITFGSNAVVEGIQLPFPGMDTTLPQSGMIEELTPQNTELSLEDRENIRLATESQLALDDPEAFESFMVDELIYGEDKDDDERRRIK